MMKDIVAFRKENSKTFEAGTGKRRLQVHLGAIHYKDDYASDESWKDIDLTWVNNRITKAPYDIFRNAGKYTIRDKKSGDVSTIELLNSTHTNFEVVPDYTKVRFGHNPNEGEYFKAQFRVTGKHIHARAYDDEGELELITSLKDGVLTEELKGVKRPVQGKIHIDPTWQVTASTDDAYRRLAPSLINLTAANSNAGAFSGTNYRYGGGFRFQSVAIGNAATITTAKLVFTAFTSRSGTLCKTRISAEDVDDAITFDASLSTFDTRWAARTAARVDFDDMATWTSNTEYDSPEIKTVIQEIVDRGGWNPNQDMVIFWDDHEDRTAHDIDRLRDCYSWDGDSAKALVLDITFITITPVTDGDLIGIGIIRKS